MQHHSPFFRAVIGTILDNITKDIMEHKDTGDRIRAFLEAADMMNRAHQDVLKELSSRCVTTILAAESGATVHHIETDPTSTYTFADYVSDMKAKMGDPAFPVDGLLPPDTGIRVTVQQAPDCNPERN